jgi:hypothetical protein
MACVMPSTRKIVKERRHEHNETAAPQAQQQSGLLLDVKICVTLKRRMAMSRRSTTSI